MVCILCGIDGVVTCDTTLHSVARLANLCSEVLFVDSLSGFGLSIELVLVILSADWNVLIYDYGFRNAFVL